MNWPPASP